MTHGIEAIGALVSRQLTPAERKSGVAYLSTVPIVAGTRFQFAPDLLEVPWTAYWAFVDREPTANWGHSCRHLLIDPESGESLSIEARFPPFKRGKEAHWRLAYRASGVPDLALLASE